MADDEGYVLDINGKRVLAGLTLDETQEFEQLDEFLLDNPSDGSSERRARDERRWLVLHDRHEEALRRHITTENARTPRP